MHGENSGTPIRAIRACKEMAIKRQRNARRRIGIRKSGRRPTKRQRCEAYSSPNRKQGSELWGNCVTAWFRYIRPPRSEPLRSEFLISAIACNIRQISQHPWESKQMGGRGRLRLGRVREEGAGQQRRPETR